MGSLVGLEFYLSYIYFVSFVYPVYAFHVLVYNVGAYRRKAAGTDRMHDFFRHDNEEAQEIRKFAIDHYAISCYSFFLFETFKQFIIAKSSPYPWYQI